MAKNPAATIIDAIYTKPIRPTQARNPTNHEPVEFFVDVMRLYPIKNPVIAPMKAKINVQNKMNEKPKFNTYPPLGS